MGSSRGRTAWRRLHPGPAVAWVRRLALSSAAGLLSSAFANGVDGPHRFDTVLYGASYYHEYMPYERLETDARLMEEAGVTVVRVGESTWASWEPQDGQFEFAWMERVVDRMHRAGIRVVLGTPTYSIPPWLYRKHPEILVVPLGQARGLGLRVLGPAPALLPQLLRPAADVPLPPWLGHGRPLRARRREGRKRHPGALGPRHRRGALSRHARFPRHARDPRRARRRRGGGFSACPGRR
jgi:hypothetical protein